MSIDIKQLRDCRRIAVLGGTFDPIHYGHLAAAEAVRHAVNPDLVLFVVAGQPPHKDPLYVTDGEHRYNMALLATADNPFFEVTRIELDKSGASYTVDTIRLLRDNCPAEATLFFIIGADTVTEIDSWRETEALFSMCRFVAVARPGYPWDTRFMADKNIMSLEVPGVAVSGTEIRSQVAAGRSIRYLLPPAVARYIKNNRLYTASQKPVSAVVNVGASVGVAEGGNASVNTNANANTTVPPYDNVAQTQLTQLMAGLLSEERFAHTMGVAEESARLAKHYGVDANKAWLAGLLHDCAKEYSRDKKRTLCQLYGVPLDEVTDKQIDLTHSALSAEAARYEYGVQDEEILQAIRYHTTGHGQMTLLDKIVMLADFIEPTREEYPGLDKMRAMALTDLNGALRVGIKQTIAYNKKRGRLIHPDGKKALRSLKTKPKP